MGGKLSVRREVSGLRKLASNRVLLWSLAVMGALAIGQIVVYVVVPVPIDLSVYRAGGAMLLAGDDLYLSTADLPFTYAPFAAVIFVPLALISANPAGIILSALSVLALGRALWLMLKQVKGSSPQVFAIALTIALVTEPMLANLSFGQVNVLLLWLVVEDVLGPRSGRIGGVLTGVAAGIKLTPGIFILMYLIVGDYRRFLAATVAFLATSLIALPFLGAEVFDFWTSVIWDSSRVGGPEFAANQSIDGWLWRFLGPNPSQLLWLALVLVVVGFALWGARREWPTSRLRAIALASLAMLLASPISWNHHWVWAIPACVALWQLWGHVIAKLLLVSGLVLFVKGLPMTVPRGDDAELGWDLLEKFTGNSYFIWAVLTLSYLVYVALVAKPDKVVDSDATTALAAADTRELSAWGPDGDVYQTTSRSGRL
jgi:alpha-1,2-mannosyltransferase